MKTIILRDECGDRVLQVLRVNEVAIEPICNDAGKKVSEHWRLDFICNEAGEPSPMRTLDALTKKIFVNRKPFIVVSRSQAKFDDLVRLAGFSRLGTFTIAWGRDGVDGVQNGRIDPGGEIKIHGGEVFTVTPISQGEES